MTAALEAALDLARRGVYILPLIGKVPHANLTPHGVKDASVDVDQIVRWFSRNVTHQRHRDAAYRGPCLAVSRASS